VGCLSERRDREPALQQVLTREAEGNAHARSISVRTEITALSLTDQAPWPHGPDLVAATDAAAAAGTAARGAAVPVSLAEPDHLRHRHGGEPGRPRAARVPFRAGCGQP